MEAGGIGCADNHCQNNEPNEFGLNRRRRQVFCHREQKWDMVWKNRKRKQMVNLNRIGKKNAENESLLKENKQGYVK